MLPDIEPDMLEDTDALPEGVNVTMGVVDTLVEAEPDMEVDCELETLRLEVEDAHPLGLKLPVKDTLTEEVKDAEAD